MHGRITEQRLTLNADLAAVRDLRDAVLTLCRKAQAEEEAASDFVLAVSEAFSNAVRHGVGLQKARIEARIQVDHHQVQVCLRYPGAPFEVDEPRLPSPDSTGGRGRFLMAVLTDQVQYQFDQGMTQATLVKQWR